MSHSRRISVSSTISSHNTSSADLASLINLTRDSPDLANLCSKSVGEIPGEQIFEVNAETSVDATCEVLIEKDVNCLIVQLSDPGEDSTIGLFDVSHRWQRQYADVNAFLSLAATSHLINEDDIDVDERILRILDAARNGKVPVSLCTDLSEKNPLIMISQLDSVTTLLSRFSKGAHRVVVRESSSVISDMNLLEWLVGQAHQIEVLGQVLEQPVSTLKLGSERVVSCFSTETVLDAMKTMSEQGLSSVAVIDMGTGDLLSTVTVTDITRIVAPSQNNKILTTPLSQFITLIKAPDGFRDGVDKYPVLSFFARLVGIPDVDPTRMQRNRTASSASSTSSTSARSRSASLSGHHISRRPSSRLVATSPGVVD
ncbi:hypothetical protein Clacol_009227 [Clathrus columnatus]|uniref:CBS domain-containing protein n=1 Tax=Clathrus columnatus TaxID=1419009 RepID=A0AAV5AJX5_9AGAM|nr:hypothetical protein Clacol_009227 [Clathrus columnatus]